MGKVARLIRPDLTQQRLQEVFEQFTCHGLARDSNIKIGKFFKTRLKGKKRLGSKEWQVLWALDEE